MSANEDAWKSLFQSIDKSEAYHKAMSASERDTHYQAWARSLWSEIREELRNFLDDEALDARGVDTESTIEKLIAQAGYDLVMTEKPD